MIDRHLTWWQHMATTDKDVYKKWKTRCGRKSYKQPFKKDVRRHVAAQKHRSILDCGAGLCSEYYGFRKDGYKIDYTAIEITEQFVVESQRKGINITQGSIHNIPYCDNSFDVCICHDTLNHLKDVQTPIEEMTRVAKHEVIVSFFKAFSSGATDSILKAKDDMVLYNHIGMPGFQTFLDGLGFEYRFKATDNPRTTLYIRISK